jgi:septal ring factor EnvC (AmiA/AmiB activator)
MTTDEKKNNFKTIKKLMTQLERKEKERVTLQAKLNRLNNDIPKIKKELYLALNNDDKNTETTTTNNFIS